MTIRALQDKLRAHIHARIDRGELTGAKLSRKAGFQQAHLSNFLRRRRGLSPETFDRLLHTLRLDVLDLVPPADVQRRALPSPPVPGLESIAVVGFEHAAKLPRFSPQHIAGFAGFRQAFLRRLRPDKLRHAPDWARFVVVRLDAATARALSPHPVAGASVLIDRHYKSLDPYRRHRRNLYAVRSKTRCLIGSLSLAGTHLVVQAPNPQLPIELLPIGPARSYADRIVGRICHVSLEL
jgi:hypothetical protein